MDNIQQAAYYVEIVYRYNLKKISIKNKNKNYTVNNKNYFFS